ncbi:MAG: DUF952 domain-containing protein [Polyangiaceae bacterium]
MPLFHITTKRAWQRALEQGRYRPPSLDSEGFIHLSGEAQWLATANRFFRGTSELLLLVLREEAVIAHVRYEPADGELFPHLYADFEASAVLEVLELALAADGSVLAPAHSLKADQRD